MKIVYIGLGKMGANMVERLLEKGHEITVYDTDPAAVEALVEKGAKTGPTSQDIVANAAAPRLVWLMVPHEKVDEVLQGVLPVLEPGDTLIDGGNSPYEDSIRRAQELNAKGVSFLDAGVSGGPGGARTGACVMVGGSEDVYRAHETLFRDISKGEGYYQCVGSWGAGHFVKMIHNGIEYGMMQALAEGFTLLMKSPFNLNLEKVADLYNHGSVIESSLVNWAHDGFKEQGGELKSFSGSVGQTGEGRWTVETARKLGVPVPIIEMSVEYRKQTETSPSYTGKMLQMLRNQFGRHGVK